MIRAPPKLQRSTAKKGATKRARYTKTVIPYTPKASNKGPFPQLRKATYKYAEVVNLSIVSGQASYLFSCNGMYDPNITGTGHQPLYFDQIMAIYDHYRVEKSRCKVTPFEDVSQAIMFTLYQDDDTSVSNVGVEAAERPGASVLVTDDSNQGFKSLWSTWSGPYQFGATATNSDMQGTATTNPSEQTYFVLQAFAPGLGTFTVQCLVEIEYTATTFELKTIAGS